MSRSRMPKDMRWDRQVAFMVGRELGDRINEFVIRRRYRSLGAAMRELVTLALDQKEAEES
jgi:Arc/MetJ-type ribon-helix-helix transcriptional regulator